MPAIYSNKLAVVAGANITKLWAGPPLTLYPGDEITFQLALTVSTISLQINGSNDGVNFVSLGAALTASGVLTCKRFAQYQFVVTGTTGTTAAVVSSPVPLYPIS